MNKWTSEEGCSEADEVEWVWIGKSLLPNSGMGVVAARAHTQAAQAAPPRPDRANDRTKLWQQAIYNSSVFVHRPVTSHNTRAEAICYLMRQIHNAILVQVTGRCGQ